jgi:hypothetical protein
MSDLFQAWTPQKPKEGFADRVAREARRRHRARRARRAIAGAVATLSLAAVALLLLVRGRPWAGTAEIHADGPNLTAAWPVGADWEEHIFPFPLVFAPDIPYRGAVRIHFSEEFDRPGQPGYWSNVTIWLTDGDGHEPDPRQLEANVRAYYTGLCGQHGHPTSHGQAPEWHSRYAHLSPVAVTEEDRALGRTSAFQGDLDALDCVTSGGELAIHLDVVAGTCASGTAYVAYAISPRSFEDPIWGALRRERRAFDCGSR